MKKIVLLLMTLAGALTVQGRVHTLQEMAERAYNFLTFEMTDGAKVSVAISSLTLTINGNTLTAGSQTFTLSNLSKMYFSNTDETTGIEETTSATLEEAAEIYDLQGHRIAKEQMTKGVYIVKTKSKTQKIVVK
ncbi:MAG: T9SS type A sorting domain-containing protein [Prevotella sp.]|nr:T9SS type A sorting domain-containing protein [Prevotella sp.]